MNPGTDYYQSLINKPYWGLLPYLLYVNTKIIYLSKKQDWRYVVPWSLKELAGKDQGNMV